MLAEHGQEELNGSNSPMHGPKVVFIIEPPFDGSWWKGKH